MSNHLISEVYKRQVGNIARKAVMGLLADKASDDGSGIWASKQRMAEEIGASKQTVIATLKSLISEGLVKQAGKRKCPNGYTIEYAINVAALRAIPLVKSHADDQSENLTGQAALPVNEPDPTSQIVLPDQSENLTQTPLNPPEPEVVEEAKASPTSARAKPNHFPKPEWADPQVWADWMEVRKEKRGRNTATAYTGFLADIARLTNDEWPPGRLLKHAVAKSWAGIYEPKEGYPTSGRSKPNGFQGQRSTRELGMEVARELEANANRDRGPPDILPRLGAPSGVH